MLQINSKIEDKVKLKFDDTWNTFLTEKVKKKLMLS